MAKFLGDRESGAPIRRHLEINNQHPSSEALIVAGGQGNDGESGGTATT
jgi:hypothetical protein